jgi:hypothetical protein
MVTVEIMEQSDLGGRIANGVQDKNRNNQEGKDFVGESCGVLDDYVQVHESSQEHVHSNPDTNPGIERQERNIQVLTELIQYGLKSQNRAETSIDHLFITFP